MVRATSAVTQTAKTKLLRKGQTTDQLLKDLKAEQKKLSEADPDKISKTYLSNLRDELIKEGLLFHKGKEVRASLACCLADLLRLYAPHAPYEGQQAATIFQFFLTVLTSTSGGLNKPSGPLFSDACTLLQTLIQSKSLLLMWDEDPDAQLVSDYFTGLFAIIKEETPKKIQHYVANALIILLSDGDVVPKRVVEVLIAHLHPSVKRTNPVASHLAAVICNGASSILQGSMGQYFTNEMVKATSKEETPAMEHSLQKIHTLIIHINKSAPAVLMSIMPQLEDGLRAENDTLREASVKTLGQMFAEKATEEGRGNHLAQEYSTTWKTWLSRSQDKSVNIRMLWVEALKDIILNHPELKADLEQPLLQKLLDYDEKVRSSMIKVFGTFDYEFLRHHVSQKILRELGERTIDRREYVRNIAMEVVGRAYSLAYSEIEKGNLGAIEQFGWIPDALMSALRIGFVGSLVAIQHTFSKYILPLPKIGQEDEVKWVKRLLLVLQSLSDENAPPFAKMSNIVDQRGHFSKFLDACQNFNGGVIDGSQKDIGATKAALIQPIEHIVSYFSDISSAAKDLNSFSKQNDARSYKLLKTIMDSRTNLKTYVKAVTEMRKKLQSSGGGGGKSNPTMIAVVRLAGFPFVQRDSIPALLSELQEMDELESGHQKLGNRVAYLLKAAAKQEPAMYLDHIPLLFQKIRDEDTKASVIANCLMILAKVKGSEVGRESVTLDKSSIKKIQKLTLQGSHEIARYAAKLLALCSINEESNLATRAVEGLCEEIAHDVAGYEPCRLVAAMATLKQFVKHASDTLRHVSTSMAQKVVQNVLLKPLSEVNKQVDESEDVADWVEDDEMNEELRARLIGVQFLTQQCLAYAEQDEVNSMIEPTLKLLFTCLDLGQPSTVLNSNAFVRARFRGVAALSLLKLARHRSCETYIGAQDFQKFAETVQDPTHQIRNLFLKKLISHWVRRTSNLPPRYFCLGFMTAFDPETENLDLVKSAVLKLQNVMTQELRLKYFDVGLARLIHLINHYPDFNDGQQLIELDSLKSAATYLEFYLDCCANQSNLACLYYIANRCKGYEDRIKQESSQGIYALSELAMCLIKRRADVLGCNVGNWAGRITLPEELYKPMPSRADQNEIYKTGYLRDDVLQYFEQLPAKRPTNGAAKRKAVSASKRGESKKPNKKAKTAKAITTTTTTPKRRGKSKRDEDEDEEESELSDEIVEDDDDDDGKMSDQETIEDDEEEAVISDDEEVESSGEEGLTEGRGARVKEKQRREKIARNEQRQKRRQAKEARDEV